ncbi:MAG: glycosyltransferase family 2 protein [Candidatus Eremiobacteraeota bacterium]|nr:glycosyltransferase family 2 protein [Candidatus Eremiobacteraeota bacterium]
MTSLPISVVVPAYNAEAFIGTTLASVLAQTRLPAEIIVVDDGSTDRTGEIAGALGARVVRQPNRGPAGARNGGLAAATQPWIAFIDADDVWFPRKLELQWAAKDLAPQASLIFSDYEILTEIGALRRSAFEREPAFATLPRQPLGDGCAFVARGDLATMLVAGNFISPSTLLLSAELLARHDLTFDESVAYRGDYLVGEDYEWYLRLLRWTDAIVIERRLAQYRLFEGSRARLRHGDLHIGEMVVANPANYPAEAVDGFRRARPKKFREVGFRYLVGADTARAKQMLGRSLALDKTPRALALYLTAVFADNAFGRAILGRALPAWRSFKRATGIAR